MTRRRLGKWTAGGLTAVTLLAGMSLATSCSIGEGQGVVTGTLHAPDCWSGKFDLQPDFFAAVPFKNTLTLRIQNGGDFQNFSDGLAILIDNLAAVRPARLGQALAVTLPPEVTPPGVPIVATADPALVHLALYMQRSCRTQNVALYAVETVTLGPAGECAGPDPRQSLPCKVAGGLADGDGGPAEGSPPDGGTLVGPPSARSRITFTHLFSGNPEESDADERLTEASFDVYLADPRDACPGVSGPPPPCRGHLTGSFKFYFQRGRPAQPFP